MFYIKSNKGYWNIHSGWIKDFSSCTLFTHNQKQYTKLPKNKSAKWMKC